MISKHRVHLPYPAIDKVTVGSCLCGWTFVYVGLGEHADATEAAILHLEEEDRTAVVEHPTVEGGRVLVPVRPL